MKTRTTFNKIAFMKTNKRAHLVFGLLAVFGFGWLSALKADVVVLQNGMVITGNVLQHDASGVLLQTKSGTYRYPAASIKEVKQEASMTSLATGNGQAIPGWAQIVSRLAASGFAPAIQQVPATVIGYGTFKNVPYVSFRCGYGDYEINVFGDLNQPAAVQIGAMNYQHQAAAEKTNCVNFMCSVLAGAADQKMIRALDWNQKDMKSAGGLTFETLLPGEMGSYGGWWVSIYDPVALANARITDAELLALAQPRNAPPPAGTVPPATGTTNLVTQPETTTTTTDGEDGDYRWTAEELANAHSTAVPANTGSTGDLVYPRTYTRTDGHYGRSRR